MPRGRPTNSLEEDPHRVARLGRSGLHALRRTRPLPPLSPRRQRDREHEPTSRTPKERNRDGGPALPTPDRDHQQTRRITATPASTRPSATPPHPRKNAAPPPAAHSIHLLPGGWLPEPCTSANSLSSERIGSGGVRKPELYVRRRVWTGVRVGLELWAIPGVLTRECRRSRAW